MSHFASIQTQFRDKDCLLKALTAMGFSPTQYATPAALKGYYGNAEDDGPTQYAHLIVSNDQLRNKADLGFHWNGTFYEAIADEHDLCMYWNYYKSQQGTFLQELTVQYQTQVAISEGYEVTGRQRLDNGNVRIIAKKIINNQQKLQNRIGGKRP